MQSTQELPSRRRRFLTTLQDTLRLAVSDRRQRQHGEQQFWAVDFAALHAFIYPGLRPAFLVTVPGETVERLFARQYVALEQLFDRWGRPLLLIPPYLEELQNHLGVLRAGYRLAEYDAREALHSKLERLIRTSPEFAAYLAAQNSNAGVTDAIFGSALRVGKQFFPELFAAVTASKGKALAVLRELFASKRLQDWQECLPEMRDYSPESGRESIRSFADTILRGRAPGMTYSSYIDGWACAFVEEANRRLSHRNGTMFLVTPSSRMRAALLEMKQSGTCYGRQLGFLRDLDYVLQLATVGADDTRLRDTLLSVEDLMRSVSGRDAGDEDFRKRVEELSLTVEAKWRVAENQYLMAGGTLDTSLRAHPSANSTANHDFLTLLRTLAKALESGGGRLSSEADALLDGLRREVAGLDEWVPRATRRALVQVVVAASAGATYIGFPGLHDELPSELRFLDAGVARIARGGRRVSTGITEDDLKQYRNRIVAEAEADGAHAEERLLGAYFLALEGQFRPALEALRRGAEEAGDPLVAGELQYLKAVILRKRGEGSLAEEPIRLAIRADPEEPRYRLEAVKVSWAAILEEEGGRTPIVKGRTDLVEKALAELKVAEEVADKHYDSLPERRDLPSYHELRAQLQNAAAFLHAELFLRNGQKANLAAALENLKELERTLQEEKWTSRFRDTQGWVLYAEARSLGHGLRTKVQDLLERSCQQFQFALQVEQSQGPAASERRLRLLEYHLEEAERALRVARGAVASNLECEDAPSPRPEG